MFVSVVDVKVFVRRAGPNYQEGLQMMRTLGKTLGVPMKVCVPWIYRYRTLSLVPLFVWSFIEDLLTGVLIFVACRASQVLLSVADPNRISFSAFLILVDCTFSGHGENRNKLLFIALYLYRFERKSHSLYVRL